MWFYFLLLFSIFLRRSLLYIIFPLGLYDDISLNSLFPTEDTCLDRWNIESGFSALESSCILFPYPSTFTPVFFLISFLTYEGIQCFHESRAISTTFFSLTIIFDHSTDVVCFSTHRGRFMNIIQTFA